MKEMPTQILPADEVWTYKPEIDDWIIEKKSGNKILSKKDNPFDTAICGICGEWKPTKYSPAELREIDWACADCLSRHPTEVQELERKEMEKAIPSKPTPEDRGSKEISTSDPEYKWLLQLVKLVTKAGIPAQEIKALAQAYPFQTINDAGDLAAKIWTLATTKYNIPREWLINKLPERKANLKQAYEGGYPTEEDATYWGWGAPYGTTAYEPAKHDSQTGLREGDTGEPIVICPKCKSDKIDKESSPAKCQVCGTDFIPKPDRGSDDPTVNDYSQNYFWGPNDLGRSHQNQPGANGWLPAGYEDAEGPSPNVRMSSLEKNASVEEAWIAPDGKEFPIEGNHHIEWATQNIDILQRYGFSPEDLALLENINLEDTTSEEDQILDDWFLQLINAGWVRLADSKRSNIQFVVELKDLKQIPAFVDKIISEHFDLNDKRPMSIGNIKEQVEIYDPFPNIQKAVNKALRQPAMSSFKSFMQKHSAIFIKGKSGAGVWLTPDHKVYKISDTHFAWVMDNLELLQDKYHLDVGNALGYFNGLLEDMLAEGWVRVGDMDQARYEGQGTGAQVSDLRRIPSFAFDYLLRNPISETPGKVIFEDYDGNWVEVPTDELVEGQKAVNKALQRKRMGKLAHCGPCSALKMEVLHILIDLYYKDNNSFPEEIIEELSVAATELKLDNFNDLLESVITEYLEEKAEEVGDKLPKLKNLLIALKDIAPKLGKEIEVVDKQENVEKEASSDDIQVGNILWSDNTNYPVIVPGKELNAYLDLIEDMQNTNDPDQLEDMDSTRSAIHYSLSRYAIKKMGLERTDELEAEVANVISEFVDDVTKKASLSLQANPSSKFWISPNGKEFDSGTHHGVWVNSNPEVLKQYGINPPKDKYDMGRAWDDMISSGWTRVSNEPAGTGFSINVNDIRNVPKYLDNFIAKYFSPKDKINIGESNSKNWVQIDNPFPSIQKAINKQLVHSKQASILDEVLDQTTQDAIAAEYGPSMLIAMRFYNDAVRYGQDPNRAMAYALEEVRRMHRPIEQRKFIEVLDTYFR